MDRTQLLAKIARLEELIVVTHAHGVETSARIRITHDPALLAKLKTQEQGLRDLNTRRRAELASLKEQLHPHKHSGPIVMYDSVTIDTVPNDPPAVAGYVGGSWPTFHPLRQKFPKAYHLSIAVNAGEDADCLDVETGDASPAQVPAWVRRQHGRGVKRPVLYANSSTMPSVLSALHGIPRDKFRVWTAHYTHTAHIEPGSDATQWTDKSHGRNLDESLCVPGFFS
jgi:hypothetical protein